ncbi:hypothetical protein [Thermovenabulum gondwanense]|nr:hypothetical protein [Thermovenabulum gondwanense]
MMEPVEYLEIIYNKLKPFFDIERDFIIDENKFDLFAKYHAKHVRTFLTPNDVIDSYNTNEYYAIKLFGKRFEEKDFQLFSGLMRKIHDNYVKPDEDHMCSIVNGIAILEDGLEEKVEKSIKSFSFEKSYFFLLKGWSRINIAAVDLKNEKIIVSRWGKNLEKVLKTDKNGKSKK